MKPYQPIDCNFYDHLEAAAVKRTVNTIVTLENSITQTYTARIVDFFIQKEEGYKVEYMKLDNGLVIRLDTIVHVNGILLEGFCKI